MKKGIFIVPVVVVVAFAFAQYSLADTASAKPFDDLWRAIRSLEQKVASLSLIPGPQGEAGPQGPAGEKGEQGIPGIPGASLLLEDGAGQQLGIFVGKEDRNYYSSLIPGTSIVVTFHQNTDQATIQIDAIDGPQIFFSESDCTGAAFSGLRIAPTDVTRTMISGRPVSYFTGIQRDAELTDIAKSYAQSSRCVEVSKEVRWLWPLEEIALPFSVPIAWPLRIVSE